MKLSVFKIYSALFGLIDLYTLIYDNAQHINAISNQLSLFTILSNIFATIVFLYLGFRKDTDQKNRNIDSIRGAIVIYMLITGIIYNIFLAPIASPNTVPWVSFIYHKLMPVIVFLGWIIYPPIKKLKFINALYWLLFPFLYLIYTLIRGKLTGWYPYFFIDPTQRGYLGVFTFSIIILIATVIGSILLIALGNWLHTKKIKILK
jgi:heme/copper-type cytochrome/quinol oxidase subunit 4